MTVDFDGLPGAERVLKGVEDLNRGVRSIEALLVAAAPQRLRENGIDLHEDALLPIEPELALYEALGAESDEDPYPRYNALRRELDSFMNALEARLSRARRAA